VIILGTSMETPCVTTLIENHSTCNDVISWACEHEQRSRIDFFSKYSFHIVRIIKEYFITSRIKHLVMWKNIMSQVMDKWYLWMKMWVRNENGWTFSITFATSFVLQKLEQKK
jgi:hypothetical protein